MNWYILVAILLIVALIIIFFVTYVLNKKTPVPKGCEDIKISDENCMACSNTECSIRKKIDLTKIEEEIKEDK